MSGNRILLVEDNRDDAELALLAFNKRRLIHEVLVARDGQEALEILFARGGPSSPLPQLVLLDLQLPKVHGLDVLRRIRGDARTARLPVVILSTSKEETDVLHGYEFGANSYIRKPVDFQQFSRVIAQLQDYWLGLNESPPLKG